MSPPTSFASRFPGYLGVLAGLAVGILLGVFISGRRNTTVDEATRKSPERRVDGGQPNRLDDGSPDSLGETLRLQKLLSEKDSELSGLRTRIEELQNQSLRGRSREEKLNFAQDLYDFYLGIYKSGNRDEMLELIKRFSQLEPEMAPFFIERYRMTREENGSYIPLELAIYSGGKEVTAFVHEVLTNGLYDQEQRLQVLRFLDGVSSDVAPVGRIQVDEQLTQVAYQLSRSEEPRERMGAAGLLGLSKSPEVSETLRKMAETDPDLSAKSAAFRALGRTEDKANVAFLVQARELWFKPGPDGALIREHAGVQKAIQTSLNQLGQFASKPKEK